MKIYSYYDASTGLFSGQSVHTSRDNATDAFAALNCPPGFRFVEGRFDPLSKRVDLATGAVVEYQPPQPTPDHVWHADTARWVLSPDVVAADQAREATLAAINAIEAKSIRALREALLALGVTGRVADDDQAIAELRKQL
jgi:hypothetical protein